MQVHYILRSGLLFIILHLVIVESKPPSSTTACCHKETLSRVIDILFIKAMRFKASVPADSIKNTKLLKKKTKSLFMKSCQFREQLLSFFMEDVLGHLPFPSNKEMGFIDDFRSFGKKLNYCALFNKSYLFLVAFSVSLCSKHWEMKPITRIKAVFYKIGNKGVFKAISELDILFPWIKNYLDGIK
ncbi:interleukin-26 [Phascolarctos cinereus]|uniref:Interleukin family protein n=1 Tax=Phascolarctos cinereus TaxID=38626 RepID=A0A6P5KK18_PHACI|nr:interleukin-26 [Phascolarctos cinereus]